MAMKHKTKYLLIGGAGFIGCNFAHKLLARGDGVIIIDNFSRKGTSDNVMWLRDKYKSLEIVFADIRIDKEILSNYVEKVDVVYHLAAQVAVTTSVINPRLDFEINILGTFNILEAIRSSQKRPILIYASTNKVYGGMEDIKIIERNNRYEYKELPSGISEDNQLDFHSPYGCSKGAGDQYVRDYARIYNLQTVVMRQSCIYGKRQFGVEDQGWVAWFAIASELNKEITIYGDGKQVRDVLYVDDLFEAWDSATKKIKITSGKIYNVGGGPKFTMSLLELIKFLEKFQNKKIKYSFSEWRPGDQPVYISDISKIKKEIGWQPSTTIEQGVEKLTKWVRANNYLFT